jgi:HEAT repeat protein
LGEIGDPVAVDALINTLKIRSNDPEDHYPAYAASRAAVALSQIGDRHAIPALLPLIGSRETAASSFYSLPLGPIVAEALGKFGAEAAEPLLQLLQHPNRDVRSDAAKALGVLKERRAVPLLLSLLTPSSEDLGDDVSYEDFKVGVESVKALGEIGDKRATQPLLKKVNVKRLLEDANDESSVVVIEALGKIRDTQVVETLFQLLPSTDSYVRLRTLVALCRIETPNLVETLLHALQQDDDSMVRRSAAEWLGKRQERRALSALQKALGDKDDSVRDSAAVAIGRIDSNILLSLLQDKDDQVRRSAVYGLGEVGCKQAVSRLLTMIGDKKLGYRVLDALGKLGTPDLLPHLESLIRDQNYSSRWAARRAIIAIKKRHKL